MKKVFFTFLGLLFIQFITAQTIKINELMASNATTIADEYGEYNDWVELYNYGSDTVNIAGCYVTDTLGYKTKHQIPAGYNMTKIPPGGYFILWIDNDSLQDGPNHVSFKLGAGGEQFGLIAPDGITYLDSITFGQQVTDISYGRYPNGNNNWLYMNFPTPGASNSLVGIENPLNQHSFKIFPNPGTAGIIYFEEAVSFKLFDATGREAGYFSEVTSLVTSNLTPGMYHMHLDDGTRAKFIVLNH